MSERISMHGAWSSRWAFILAATGSAVGLGNIWKFPYITGENGGGAFVLVYLLCIALIGIPVMISEVLIGRRGRRNPVQSMQVLAEEAGRSRWWGQLGGMGVLAGFLILSYYSVIGGWALAYVFKALFGEFAGQSQAHIDTLFSTFQGSPDTLFIWHTIFMAMTLWVVARGVSNGLEKAVRFLMPALFVLLLVMVAYATTTGYFEAGLRFLFEPDFSKLTTDGVLIAMGHAFFTLSLGMGAIMVYGSYLPAGVSISRTVFYIAGADTLVALLAGMAIFPIVFAHHLEPGAGPGLIFQTLPLAFGEITGGALLGALFFLLLVFAAWSSAISLIEPAVTWLMERFNISRIKAVVISGTATWLLGIATVLSFNAWSDVTLFGKTFFDLLDYLTANIMLPLGGLLLAVFAAWLMRREHSMQELGLSKPFYTLWYVLVRYVTPIGVVFVFANAIGLLG